jgi:hypothetical protein
MLFMIVLSTTLLIDRFVRTRPNVRIPPAHTQRLRVVEYQP